MNIEIEIIVLLMAIVSVAMVVRHYSSLPYTIALIFAGIVLSVFNTFPDIHLTPELIFHVLLPPLLFEAAFNLNVTESRENLKPILIYAVFGVIVSTLIIAYTLKFLLDFTGIHIPFEALLLFGAVISSTDPISVLAIFKELGVPKRLSAIIEGESLLNDGISVVVFGIILNIAINSAHFSLVNGIKDFLLVAVGGAIIGTISGLVFSRITALVDDHLIEITLTTIVTYLTYIIAEHFEVSGVIAVIFAGLMVGNYGTKIGMSPTTRVSVKDFWEYIAFVINSVVFFMIGLEVSKIDIIDNYIFIIIGIIAVLAGRAGSIFTLTPVINLIDKKIPFKWQFVFIWGGVRGALVMALALAIPKSYEYRDMILIMTFSVAGFSLIVQGLSIKGLLNLLNLGQKNEDLEKYEYEKGRLLAINSANEELETMYKNGIVSQHVYTMLTNYHKNDLEKVKTNIEELAKNELIKEYEFAISLKRLLLKKKDAVHDAIKHNIISIKSGEKLISLINKELLQIDQLIKSEGVK
jgi:CPA1 family monovalent cation:H+ antiporter